jgi:hypothetical protein
MKTKVFVIIFYICAVSLHGCVLNSNFPTGTRNAPPALPKYPNALQEDSTIGVGVTGFKVYITTFNTSDTGESVVAFYRDRLLKSGWETFGKESFLNKEMCPFYVLYISSAPLQSGATKVELKLVEEPCQDR